MNNKMIPKKIYQSWKTKNLPPKMADLVQKIKEMNPEYEHEIWDDNDCRTLLLENFGENYANAFDALIPGAFKCDFWRYAVLYLYGGVYIDMDMTPVIPLREILLDTDRFVSIVDMKVYGRPSCAIYQAFIAVEPKHPIMKYALELTFSNIANRKFDYFESLSVTGPVVAGIAVNLYWKKADTFSELQPGVYTDGIRLFEMNPKRTWDLDGKTIFNNKFESYTPINNYATMLSYYKNDPRLKGRRITVYGVLGLLLLLVILISYIVFKRFKCK